MQYFAFIRNNLIDGCGQCEQIAEGLISLPISEEEYNNIVAHGNNYYIYEDEELKLNPNYAQEEQAKEQDRINHLTMTPLDFLKVLYYFGLTREQVYAFLAENPEIDEQLKYCQNVYCGVVKSFLPITIGEITLTSAMVEQVFISKGQLLE